jgi:hypothetical protein
VIQLTSDKVKHIHLVDMTSVCALLYQKLAVSHKHTCINIVVEMTSVCALLYQKLAVSHKHTCINTILIRVCLCDTDNF